MYNTEVFKEAPTSWNVVFEAMDLPDGKPNAGRVQAFDGPIYIADAALYLMTHKPELGIKDPYELNEDQYKAALELLRAAAQDRQPLLARRLRADRRLHERGLRRLVVLAVPGQHPEVAEAADRHRPCRGRRDRVGRHHDDARRRASIRTAPICGWSIRSTRSCRAISRAWFGSVPAVLAACKGNALLTDAGCDTNGLGNFDKIHFWRTPSAKCAEPGDGLRAVLSLGLGLHRHPRRATSEARDANLPLEGRSSRSDRRAAGLPPLRSAEPLAGSTRPGGVTSRRWRLAADRRAVRFQNVSRHFGDVRAVDDVSLAIGAGEFFAMLGPSGSGKTTCLRLIAGFDQPTRGHIEIFGETAEGVPPYRRNVNTVFQDYALFPHMSVLDNVAYGLMVRASAKPSAAGRRARRSRSSSSPAWRRAGRRQLSGGQRQRVALARALVNRPKVLLLDEPLGALDLKLREQMQVELKALQQQLGITFVFVTHDQGEALSMADRVAIFNEGKLVQVGTPATSTSGRRPASSPISSAPPTCSTRISPRALGVAAGVTACGRRRSGSARAARTPAADGSTARPKARSPPSSTRAPIRRVSVDVGGYARRDGRRAGGERCRRARRSRVAFGAERRSTAGDAS